MRAARLWGLVATTTAAWVVVGCSSAPAPSAGPDAAFVGMDAHSDLRASPFDGPDGAQPVADDADTHVDGAADDASADVAPGDGPVDRAPADAEPAPLDTRVPPADAELARSCAALGQPCTVEGEGCSEGDSHEISCRTFRICRGGHWQAPQSFLAPCQAPGPNACPAAPGTGACGVAFQTCAYDDGTSCTCATTCESGADAGACSRPLRWVCSNLNSVPARQCPLGAPQLGSPCGDRLRTCDYGAYCAAYEVECRSSVWQLRSSSSSPALGGCA